MVWVIVILIIGVDRLSKFFLNARLTLHQRVPVIDNVLYLTLVHNRGAAFGILKNQTPLFIAASAVAIVLLVVYLRSARLSGGKLTVPALALGLVLAGAVGNLIDRVFLGYVIDFIDVGFWPVFNVADSAISVGAVLLAYSLFKSPRAGGSEARTR